MQKRIIAINEEKCNGCGACALACHEGAIGMVNGKARLLREDHCDGLGDCLPVCPTGAIRWEPQEADDTGSRTDLCAERCPGTAPRALKKEVPTAAQKGHQPSRLMQWPCQIRLVPTNAPYFNGANLLVAADCTAYAYAGFHEDFMRNHITLIGCTKLDGGDYTEKLQAILTQNDIRSVKILRMEVPCCGGMETAVKNALRASGKFIPWQVITLTTDGKILD